MVGACAHAFPGGKKAAKLTQKANLKAEKEWLFLGKNRSIIL